jgi:hypothetical protein
MTINVVSLSLSDEMGTIEGVKWQHFSNVVVLQLLIGSNEVLDLQALQ